nr:MAG: putative RNA-dependent RNA polymerase [Picobirnaviridae sp.]
MGNYSDPRLQGVISNMRKIASAAAKLRCPRLTQEQKRLGFESSRKGAAQEQEVHMTPLMKNALKHYDNWGDNEKHRLMVNEKPTKAEQAIVANMKQLLLEFNGSSSEFDETLPLFDKRHYDVQCHQNLKENLRDIQPGQADTRNRLAHDYTKPTSNSVEQIIQKIESDSLFQLAIKLILDQMPAVRASDEIREINLPFMTKHSGVGAFWWRNDRTVDPKTGKTYAEITMSTAEQIKNEYDKWDEYNIATMYGRDQRGKGRLLIAIARVLNLLLNQLEGVEIPTYKDKWPLFVGYRDDEALKQALITVGEECEARGLKCANEDYSTFDFTVGQGINALVGALSIEKANGSRSKQIAFKRAVYAQKTWLMNGLSNEVLEIYGRIFSGYIDTNRGGGIANAIQMTYEMMKLDPNYSSLIYSMTYYMLVMGDDNLHVYSPKVSNFRENLAANMKKDFGGVINEKKYEFGPIFLQYRVFKDPTTKEYVMVYAWTRVVRSMLMKEQAKGLGPVGWTYAFYQQLWKLYEYPEAFSIAVNLLIPFDNNKFFMNTPIPELNKMLQEEDNAALAKANTDAQKRRVSSTWDRLADGDPSKARFNEENVGLLEKIQARIREVYDPHFYNKHGLNY